MEIIFLGKSKWIPDEVGGDAPCFVVDGKYLVDLGYKSALKLSDIGIDLSDIDHVFVTHCHHDHVLGMPLFLFLKSQKKGGLTHIYGISDEIADTVHRAESMCMFDKYYADAEFTRVHELCGGEGFTVEEELKVECMKAEHSVPALCYRFTINGKALGILGDSRYTPEIAEFFKGCDAVIHEVSMGIGSKEHESYSNGHSCAYDAAKTAIQSGTKAIYLVHCSLDSAEGCISAIKETYNGEVIVPDLGKKYII